MLSLTRRLLLLALLSSLVSCIDSVEPTASRVQGRTTLAPDEGAGAEASTTWTAAVTTRIRDGEHQFRPHSGALTATNRPHGLRLAARARGLLVRPLENDEWELILGLSAVSRGGWREVVEPQAPVLGPCSSWGRVDAHGECLRKIERAQSLLAEWWESRRDGVAHAWTLDAPPPTNGPVVFDLHLAGLPVEAVTDAAIRFRAADRVLQYGGLAAFDARGRHLPARFMVGDHGVAVHVEVEGAVWPIRVDPVLTTASWAVTGAAHGDELGFALAGVGDLNGDGYGDVAVGAPGTTRGSVFLYYGGATGLPQDAALTLSGVRDGSRFGAAVAGLGDITGDGLADLAVGAPMDGFGQNEEGWCYVFAGNAQGISDTPIWTLEPDLPLIHFGTAVAAAGDVDGDGFGDLIVGAPDHTAGGAAYLYRGSAGAAPSPQTLTGGWIGGRFGISLAGLGDVNGDGYADVAVGSPRYGMTEQGRVRVYHGSAAGLDTDTVVNITGASGGEDFGHAVAGPGDVNGDGYADLLVGAPQRGTGGYVALHPGSGSGVLATPIWTLSSTQPTARLGAAVGAAGDLNGDGHADLAVGAPAHDVGLLDVGRVDVYLGTAGGVRADPALVITGVDAGENLGAAVATAGDVDGDGFSEILIGSPYLGGATAATGGAMLLEGAGADLGPVPTWNVDGPAAYAEMGFALAGAGDVNGDGYDDVIVGARAYSEGEATEGAAFLFLGGPDGPDTVAAWSYQADHEGAQLGRTVAGIGDINGDGRDDVAVGAPNFQSTNPSAGRAFVFRGSSSGLSRTPSWTADGTQSQELFGFAVAAAGDLNRDGFADLAVGAPGYSGDHAHSGRVAIFRGSPSGLERTAAWSGEGDRQDAAFGQALAGVGDLDGDGYGDLLVGAPAASADFPSEGAVFLYRGDYGSLLATPSWAYFSGAAGARLGTSVAGVGDVNGDGYPDFLTGAPDTTVGQTASRGAAHLFLGGPTGPGSEPDWTAIGPDGPGSFGASVAGAGDVDGDGLPDVVIGAPDLSVDQEYEGEALLYHGSAATGLATVPSWIGQGNRDRADFGRAVAGAGDVDGDGFADVLIGASRDATAAAAAGRAYLYRGNGADATATALPPRPELRQPGTTTRLAPGALCQSEDTLTVFLHARGFAGRSRFLIELEVEPPGTLFDGAGLLRPDAWADGAVAGSLTAQSFAGLERGAAYHWRARLRLHPSSPTPQPWSRWYYGGRGELPQGKHVQMFAACDTAADCDDANPCTEDLCGGLRGCYHDRHMCDDGSVCTTDTCDPASGCVFTPIDCQDGLFCNGEEVCDPLEGCGPGEPPPCDDGDACTVDACDEATGCVHNVAECDDGSACTEDSCDSTVGCIFARIECSDGDACNGLETCDHEMGCRPGAPPDCEDFDVCTDDSCDPAEGCVHATVECDDGDACNGLETCNPVEGCLAGTPPDCDDGDLCNGVETCAADSGCVAGTPLDCDDQDACTTTSCDAAAGCVTAPVVCDDGNLCNGVESCDSATGCVAGSALDCDDGNACTDDSCDSAAGCLHPRTDCNDHDPCTTDTCDPARGCVHTAVDCDDGNPCNGVERCRTASGCTPGTPPTCDDGDACTTDGCDPATGCTHAPAVCADDDLCTDDECDPETGCTFSARDCDDADPCTEDDCDSATGCTHAFTACDDGNACTTDGCLPDGTCTHDFVTCDDGDFCTADRCVPTTGCTAEPVDCADFDPCTDDGCDPSSGCTHTTAADGTPCAAERVCIAGACTDVIPGEACWAPYELPPETAQMYDLAGVRSDARLASSCTGGEEWGGPDLFFLLSLEADVAYLLEVSGLSAVDVRVALVDGCAQLPDCVVAVDDAGLQGTETLRLNAGPERVALVSVNAGHAYAGPFRIRYDPVASPPADIGQPDVAADAGWDAGSAHDIAEDDAASPPDTAAVDALSSDAATDGTAAGPDFTGFDWPTVPDVPVDTGFPGADTTGQPGGGGGGACGSGGSALPHPALLLLPLLAVLVRRRSSASGTGRSMSP